MTQILIHRCKGHNGPVECLSALPIDNLIASGGWDHKIRLWDTSNGSLVATIHGHKAWVISLHGAPEEASMVSASDDGTVREWDLKLVRERTCLFETDTMLKSVRYSPCGRYIAVAGWNGSVWMLNRTGEVIWTQVGAHTSHIWRICFAPNGHVVATAGDDGTIRLWNVRTGNCVCVLTGVATGVESIDFSPGGNRLYSAGFDGVRSWDVKTAERLWYIQTKLDHLLDVAVSPDGQKVATCGTGRVVRILDRHGESVWMSPNERDNLVAIVFDRKQRWLASAGDDGEILVWQLHEKVIGNINQHLGSNDTQVVMQNQTKNNIASENPSYDRLKAIYDQLPKTDCARCLDCCRVCPPVSFAEMRKLDEIVFSKSVMDRQQFFIAVLRTEFLGRLVLIGACPFLFDGACSIYNYRPIACRQFGLTSEKYYADVLRRNQAKCQQVTAENELLQPTLQDQFPPTYCTEVLLKTGGEAPEHDATITSLYRQIEKLETNGHPLARGILQISYGLGILIRCWGVKETQERLSILAIVVEAEEPDSGEALCQKWALELDRLLEPRI